MTDLYDIYDEDDTEDAAEWQEGECDNCHGSTAEDLKRAANGSGINPVCACAIGQGADPDECRCGPPVGDEN